MKPLEHTSTLLWVVSVAAIGWLLGGFIAYSSAGTYRGEDTTTIALAVSGVCFAVMVPAAIGMVVLRGVRQMLEQMRATAPVSEPQRDAPAQTVLPPQPGP